ncbi:hypothetical protein GCM10010495_76110 [Kitasatospora herbaricolor]|nr:hypothetical protein GCM10010495_76110 [Kitasatospora herbaricolor]
MCGPGGSGGADLQGQRGVGEALLEEVPVGVLVEALGAGLGRWGTSRGRLRPQRAARTRKSRTS